MCYDIRLYMILKVSLYHQQKTEKENREDDDGRSLT